MLFVDADERENLRFGVAQVVSQVLDTGRAVDLMMGGANPEKVAKKLSSDIGLVALSMPFTFGHSVECNVDWGRVRDIIKVVRRANLPLVIGGGGFTLEPEARMKQIQEDCGPLADGIVAVEGEGDKMIRELSLRNGNPSGLGGLWSFEKGRIVTGFMQALTEKELAQLAPVDPRLATTSFEATTRGCPSSCAYCSSCNLTKRGVRKLPQKSFVEKMRSRIFESGRYAGYIVDNDALARGMKWWRQVKEFMEKEGLLKFSQHLSIGLSTNPERVYDLTLEDLKVLRQIGICNMIVGVQSFDPETLRRNNRPPVDVNRLLQFCELCYQAGVYLELDMIYGLPTGTQDQNEINRKLDQDVFYSFVAAAHARAIIQYRDLSIIKGSQLYREGYDGSESYKGGLHSSRLKFLFEYLRWHNLARMTERERANFTPILELSKFTPEMVVQEFEGIVELGGQITSAIFESSPEMIQEARILAGLNRESPKEMLEKVLQQEEVRIRANAGFLTTPGNLPEELKLDVKFRERERLKGLREMQEGL